MKTKGFVRLALTAISLAVVQSSWAAGYQVLDYFYNAETTGDAGSGGAAIATDASTAFANPAGLVRIPNYELVVAGSYLSIRTKFTGSNTWQSTLLPPGFNTYTETGTANGGLTQFLPAIHFSMPINCQWWFGFSAAPTYGLATYYDNTSILRYNSTRSSLKVMNLSPVVAYAINNQWSLGGGLDFAYADLIFRAMAGFPTLSTIPTEFDSLSRNTAKGWGVGAHAGVLYQMPCTRIGLNYRSRISLTPSGRSKLFGPGFEVNSGGFSLNLVLPPIVMLSAYQNLTPSWGLLGTVQYTQWSTIPGNVFLYNVATPLPTTVKLPWRYHDSWFLALGTDYKITPCWLVRGGVHYDQTPIPNSARYPVIPDQDRYAVAIGTHYQVIKCVGVDVGWSHFFVRNPSFHIPTTVATQTSTPNGTSKNSVDIVSAQLTWDMA